MTTNETLRSGVRTRKWIGITFVLLTMSRLGRADGVPVLVKGIGVGAAGSFPTQLTDVNGTLFFRANDHELWRSDGTDAGTAVLKNSEYFDPTGLMSSYGKLYFSGWTSTYGRELWRSDGTPAGTVLVKNVEPGSACNIFSGCIAFDSNPAQLTGGGAFLFFKAFTSSTGYELWRSDGTEAGTVLVDDITPGDFSSLPFPFELTNANGTLFFVVGSQLWRTDGGAPGTFSIAEGASGLTDVNGTLFFAAYDDVHGHELWRSDGTVAGTTVVADIAPGFFSSDPAKLANVDGALFFIASYDPFVGYHQLWRSDGTAAGTVLVADLIPGYFGKDPGELTAVGGTLFFTAYDDVHGHELWRSDGTAAGTELLKDIAPGADSSDPAELTDVGGTLYFTAFDPAHGRELWRIDGTATGTVLVSDIFPGPEGSSPTGLTNVNGALFFAALEPSTGVELWALGVPSPASPCGNGVVDPGEECDSGPGSCCTEDCRLRADGAVCRPSMGSCDVAEICDGLGATCPADVLAAAGTPCPTSELCSNSATCSGAGTCQVVLGPQSSCKASASADLELRYGSSEANDKASWKWNRGAVTAKAEFGDPTSATDYALCIFDTTAGVPVLVSESGMAAGGTCAGRPCWKPTKVTGIATKAGFQYTNKNGALTKLTLAEGLSPGRAKITLKGKGANLPLPPLPLAQDPTVTVQRKNRAGGCWGTDFSSALVNDGARFKARSN